MAKLLLPEKTADLSPVQQGWLSLAEMKIKTFDILTKGELAVQGELKDIRKEKELPVIQEKLKKAKDIAAEKKEARLHLTNTINEKLFVPAIAFEKRNEALIKDASDYELERRKELAKEAEDQKKVDDEKRAYEAHIKNEFLKIQTAYKLKMERRVLFYYKQAMDKKKMTKVALAEFTEDIKKELANIELEKPEKFKRILLSVEDAKAIIKKVDPYNPQPDLDAAIKQVDNQFSMYNEDFKNKEKAKQKAEELANENEADLNKSLEQEQAINTLMSSTSTELSLGAPVVKKKTVIVEENTVDWAKLVISNFLANMDEAVKYLRVKSWSKLSLTQMAAALSETNKTFKGLKTKEVEK